MDSFLDKTSELGEVSPGLLLKGIGRCFVVVAVAASDPAVDGAIALAIVDVDKSTDRSEI